RHEVADGAGRHVSRHGDSRPQRVDGRLRARARRDTGRRHDQRRKNISLRHDLDVPTAQGRRHLESAAGARLDGSAPQSVRHRRLSPRREHARPRRRRDRADRRSSDRLVHRPPPCRRVKHLAAIAILITACHAQRPTIVFESGLGDDSRPWKYIATEVRKTAPVFTYDRAGLGTSAPATTPRTPKNIARELHERLAREHIAPPYILVSHSAGAWYALQF